MKSDAKKAFIAGWADVVRIDISQMKRVFYNNTNGRFSFDDTKVMFGVLNTKKDPYYAGRISFFINAYFDFEQA